MIDYALIIAGAVALIAIFSTDAHPNYRVRRIGRIIVTICAVFIAFGAIVAIHS